MEYGIVGGRTLDLEVLALYHLNKFKYLFSHLFVDDKFDSDMEPFVSRRDPDDLGGSEEMDIGKGPRLGLEHELKVNEIPRI